MVPGEGVPHTCSINNMGMWPALTILFSGHRSQISKTETGIVGWGRSKWQTVA